MRHLAKIADLFIDPWGFAQHRQTLSGSLRLDETQNLQDWAGSKQDEIVFALSGDIDAHKQYRLSGNIAVTLHTQCQRCLEAMDFPVRCEFDYVLIRHQDQENQVVDGSETFICVEDTLNIAWFLEEEILLAIPMIAKHENCNMPQMGSEVAKIESLPNESPFAQLKNMIIAQENIHGSSTKS